MHFVTTIYGNKLTGFLPPMLQSVLDSGNTITVYYFDFPYIDYFTQKFPLVEFKEVPKIKSESDKNNLVSIKISIWKQAVQESKEPIICLADCDVLVLKSIDDIKFNADISFTSYHGKRNINTGVVVVKPSLGVVNFFEDWISILSEVKKDPMLNKQANDDDLPFGGFDQMAFQKLIKYTNKQKHNYKDITLESYPCEILNHIEQKPITENTRIIHLKGHTQAILTDGVEPRGYDNEKINVFKKFMNKTGGNKWGLNIKRQTTVSVSMIVRNSSDVLQRCLESVKDADEIVIVDTGSEDNTIEIAKKYTDKVYTYYGCNNPKTKDGLFSDFADARNKSLSYCTGTHILTIDADEYLEAGGMDVLKSFRGRAMSIRCISTTSGEEHRQPRLYLNHPSIYWKGAAHNYLTTSGGVISDVKIRYGRNNQRRKDPDRTMRILQSEVKKNPKYAREWYYLAKEYHRRNWFKKAIKTYKKYILLSKFPNEKADAFLQLARCYLGILEFKKTITACHLALDINPQFSEVYRMLADLSQPINRLKYKHIACKTTNEGVLFKRFDNRLKVTMISDYDWAGSGFRIVEEVRKHSNIDIEAITLTGTPGTHRWNMQVGVALEDAGREVVQERINQSDIIHYKCDKPYNYSFFGLTIPKNKKIIQTVSGSWFRQNGKPEDYIADLCTYMTKDLTIDGWKYTPQPYTNFNYKWKRKEKFVIGHIPSDPEKKGTAMILEAIKLLNLDNISLLYQDGIPHSESIKLKGECSLYIDQMLLPPVANASYEAMAQGVPVITWTDDDIAISPQEQTAESLAAKITEYLDWDKLEKESIRQYRLCEVRCSNIGKQWIETYKQLLK